jgi:hypothetical protein
MNRILSEKGGCRLDGPATPRENARPTRDGETEEQTMAELKTKKTKASVAAFLNGIEDERIRKDSKTIARMMKDATGASPKMWGTSIVGYGSHHYKYASGREGDWFLTGFSPRKRNLTLYLSYGLEKQGALLKKLGKHKTGKACLYINKLEDVDTDVLRELIERQVKHKSATGC